MARFFRPAERRQGFLLPPDMADWLPADDIVHLIIDAVSLLDLSGFEAQHRVGGAEQAPFAPSLLLTVLVYAYSHGVRSSRAIERLCGREAGYRFIVGEHGPDHSVIARFRRRHVERAETTDAREDRLARLRACQDKLERQAAEAAACQHEKIDARAAEVTTEANDVRQLVPMLDLAQAVVAVVMGEDAILGAAVADAGYWSEANAASQTEECDLFIATRQDRKQRAELRDAPAPRGRIPRHLSVRGRMRRKLRTRRGRVLYRQRGASVDAGIRPDERPPGRRPLQHAWPRRLPRRMAPPRRRPQQAVIGSVAGYASVSSKTTPQRALCRRKCQSRIFGLQIPWYKMSNSKILR